MFDFNTIINRKNTKSIKWDFTKLYFNTDDVLPMWVADMDFASPPSVTEALIKRASHPAYGYTGVTDSLYEAVKNWMYKKHHWSIKRECITNTPGVVPALTFAILEFSEPGDKIIIQTPVYYPFQSIIQNNGRKLIVSELKREGNDYYMDFDLLKKQIDKKTKILILCSPHNPIGRVWKRKELEELGNICVENNILILSDEIHMDIVYKDNKHIPIASINSDIDNNTLTFTAPSKTFNIAGLSASNVIINDSNKLKRFNNRKNGMGFVVGNLFGIEALEAAYNYGYEWLDELLVYLSNNIDFIENSFKDSIIDIIRPQGTYLMWMDFSKLNLTDEKIGELLLTKAKVALDPGSIFGHGGKGYQRLNFACPLSLLKEGIERIKGIEM